MTGKTYNSKEICEMFSISAPRLLQFRKGQQVKVKTNKPNVLREYKFDPLLEEGKDWYWDGSEVVFKQSSVIKLSKRKTYNKTGQNLITVKTQQKADRLQAKAQLAQQMKQNGEYTVQEISDKLKISVQKIYSLRDISTNKPVSYTDYLIQNKDWRYEDGKVILMGLAKEKIKGYANLLIQKQQIPKVKRIGVLVGTKIFHLTGSEADAIIDLLTKYQERKRK